MAQEFSERQQAILKELMSRDDLDDRQKSIVNELEKRFLDRSQQEPASSVTPSTVVQPSFAEGAQPKPKEQSQDIPRINEGGPFSQFLATPESLNQTKDVFIEIASVAPEMTLGTVGSLLGFSVGGPPGAVVGAGLGAGAGNAMGQILQRADLLPGVPPGTSEEAAKEIGIAAALGLAGEGVGQVAVKTGSKLLSPFGSGVSPRATRIQRLLKDAPKEIDSAGNPIKTPFRDFFGFNKGLTLSPASAVDSGFLDIVDNVSRNSFFGSGPLRRSTDKIISFLTDRVDDFVNNFSKAARTTDDVGTLFQETLENGSEIHRAVGRVFYENLDEVIGNAQLIEKKVIQTGVREIDEGFDVVLGRNIKRSQPILREVDEIVRGGVDLKPLKANIAELEKRVNMTKGNPGLKRVFTWVKNNDDIISFADAHDLRSDLSSIGRMTNDLQPDRAKGFAKGFAQRIDKQMSSAINDMQAVAPAELQSNISDMWRNADDFWKQGKTTFNSRVVKSLINADADKALDFIVRSKDKTKRISGIREALIDNPKKTLLKGGLTQGQKEQLISAVKEGEVLMKNFQSAWFERMMLDSIDLEGNLVGSKLLQSMKAFNGKKPFAQGPVKELFKGRNFIALQNFVDSAKNLFLVQKPLPEGVGRVFIQLKQPQALEKVVKSSQVVLGVSARAAGLDALSNLIIFGPAVASQIFTTPILANFLINGIKTGAMTRNTTTFLTRFAALLKSKGIESRLASGRELSEPVDIGTEETTTPTSPFSKLGQLVAQ